MFPVFGFSINTLSLFGLVLAIGLVVDDAIVVVEAVERHIEEGLTPKAAALKAMEEISGPVIGIALVLSAVFVPTVFIPGITGRLYQQFAVTIAICGDPFGLQRADAESRAVRIAAPAETGEPRPAAPILRRVQSRLRPCYQRLHSLVRAPCCEKAWWCWRCWWWPARAPRSSADAFPPASCRAKTRATCSCTCNCRMRPRWSGPRPPAQRSKTFCCTLRV